MPPWMAGIDSFTPVKALGLGVLLAGVNPKNLMLAVAAGTGSRARACPPVRPSGRSWSSWSSAASPSPAPVVYYLFGGSRRRGSSTELKAWLAVHDDAVMTVLFLVFGVDLVAKGLPPLT